MKHCCMEAPVGSPLSEQAHISASGRKGFLRRAHPGRSQFKSSPGAEPSSAVRKVVSLHTDSSPTCRGWAQSALRLSTYGSRHQTQSGGRTRHYQSLTEQHRAQRGADIAQCNTPTGPRKDRPKASAAPSRSPARAEAPRRIEPRARPPPTGAVWPARRADSRAARADAGRGRAAQRRSGPGPSRRDSERSGAPAAPVPRSHRGPRRPHLANRARPTRGPRRAALPSAGCRSRVLPRPRRPAPPPPPAAAGSPWPGRAAPGPGAAAPPPCRWAAARGAQGPPRRPATALRPAAASGNGAGPRGGD